jgi:hypothetical protein
LGWKTTCPLSAFVAQVLQKIFDERLHVRRITKAACHLHDETLPWQNLIFTIDSSETGGHIFRHQSKTKYCAVTGGIGTRGGAALRA